MFFGKYVSIICKYNIHTSTRRNGKKENRWHAHIHTQAYEHANRFTNKNNLYISTNFRHHHGTHVQLMSSKMERIYMRVSGSLLCKKYDKNGKYGKKYDISNVASA